MLTLDEKIGQLIMFGFHDVDSAVNLIKRYKFGNIVYFKRNLGIGKEVVEMSNKLQRTMLDNVGIPAIISSDQEGGMVSRFYHDATSFPGAMTTTAASDKELTYETGQRVAEELIHYGINLNLAPVLDINSNKLNPVIGVRSFSDNKESVVQYALNIMQGMQDKGVMACGKHFPGHGDTSMDSHISLPTIEHDINRLDEVELFPFKEAISKDISAIMTAHLLIPKIEEKKIPATMSEKILTGILRDKLGFKGIIMTDCLEMDAVSKHYGVGKGALMSLLAGSDLVLISHTAKYQIEAFNTIKEAVQDGTFSEELLDEKVERILNYKKKFNLLSLIEKIKPIPLNILEKNAELSHNIIEKSLTLVKDRENLLPLRTNDNVFVVSPIRKVNSVADDVLPLCDFAKELSKKIGCAYKSFEDSKELGDEKYKEILLYCKNADKVVVGTYNAYRDESQQRLLRDIVKVNPNVILVALRIPYDASLQESEIPTAICSYEYTDNSVEGLCDSLSKSTKYVGKLPVSIN